MQDRLEPLRHEIDLATIRFAAWRWSPPAGAEAAGRRLVILHGVTASAMAFDEVARAIASDGWTVDALDLPGHGGTRWLDADGAPLADQESVGADAYELQRVGDLVAAAVRALPPVSPPPGGERSRFETEGAASGAGQPRFASGQSSATHDAPVILGHSWGAGVAVMAIDAGAPVRHLVLLDPPFLTPQQGIEMAEGFRAELRPEAAEGFRAELRPEDAARRPEMARAEVLAPVHDPGTTDRDPESGARALPQTSPLAADSIARGAPLDPIRLMAEWRSRHPDLPVDVIAGDPLAGGLVPAPIQSLLRMALGAAHVHALPGLGHSPHNEDLGRFLEVLRGVLGSPDA